MRKIATAAALALAAVGSAGAAGAQSFDDFVTVCGSNDLDPAVVRAAADGLGWAALPESALQAFSNDADGEAPFTPLFVMASSGDGVGLLIFARTEMPLGEGAADADLCMFLTEEVSDAEARTRLEGLGLGSLIQDDEEEGAYMVYSRGPDGVRDEKALAGASDEEMTAILRDRPLFMMGFDPGDQLGLVKVRFRGDSPADGGN
ncbi:hypothetical protein [Brevundimonas sp. Root1279]|uniref:hypothetical protein n=1 Tax=Brevundimonas sp. Root1279 TaxID=1736443 RepID=UPI0006FC73DC|nr:hypothetical protein [Brevundimonas sp. Root1279]KQW81903.1 hypothetical protein ASC65_11495 [Brevundimonas sp. Root1279]